MFEENICRETSGEKTAEENICRETSGEKTAEEHICKETSGEKKSKKIFAKCIGYNGYNAHSLQKCIIDHKTAFL